MSKSAEDADARGARGIPNKVMLRLSDLLGLTTGIGVVAWGAWSLVATVTVSIYERTGVDVEHIVIEDAFNQGVLQSAMLIALGVIILELRRIGDTLEERAPDL